MGNSLLEDLAPVDFFTDSDLARPQGPVALAKVRFYHDAIIDLILTNPSISQNELAQACGYSATWISIIVNSDSFKERLSERKAELVDPKLRATIAEKVDGAANRALDRIIDRLDSPVHGSIKTQDLVSIAKLGVAPKTPPPPAAPNLYVVALPAPAGNSVEWLQSAQRTSTPRGPSEIIDITPGVNPAS
jgi:hypothetical protein